MKKLRQSESGSSEHSLAQRSACLEHARNLIAAAKRVLGSDNSHANIAYHLGVLALEELGKAGLIVSRAIAEGKKDTRWIDKRLDDHAFKLTWAIWSPMMLDSRVDPEKLEQAKRFARSTHDRRLEGLYVNVERGSEHFFEPQDAVSLGKARSIIDLAEALLDCELERKISTLPENDELLDWFFKTAGSKDGAARLFSKQFIDKLETFGDDVRAWVKWAKQELERIQQEEQQLLRAELARKPGETDAERERWLVKIRLVSQWHTFQQKTLNAWNDILPSAKLHVRAGTNNKELTLSLRLSNAVRADEIFDAALVRSKMLLTALNIGSAGFIWYDVSDQSQELFQSIVDLENPQHKVEIKKSVGASSLRMNVLDDGEWRASETMSLHYVRNALNCMVAFFSIENDEAAPIFAPYMNALALLSMSNFHVSCDEQAGTALADCLSHALAYFDDWDGEVESKRTILHTVLTEVIEEEHRDALISWDIHDGEIDDNRVRAIFHCKRLIDLYLALVAHRICEEKIGGT